MTKTMVSCDGRMTWPADVGVEHWRTVPQKSSFLKQKNEHTIKEETKTRKKNENAQVEIGPGDNRFTVSFQPS